LHLLGLRWRAWSSLGGLLLGHLGAAGMMLLMLLLGLNTADEKHHEHEDQASRLAR
jgi:hypothetical protein